MMTEKKDWSTKELSEAAKVTRQYVVKLLNMGKIKGHKVGSYWVIRDYDAKQWLENRQ